MVTNDSNHFAFGVVSLEKKLKKTIRHRPQVGFLEAVGLMGSVPPVVSPSEQNARAEFERRQRAVPL